MLSMSSTFNGPGVGPVEFDKLVAMPGLTELGEEDPNCRGDKGEEDKADGGGDAFRNEEERMLDDEDAGLARMV
jgi:hypothetical protein